MIAIIAVVAAMLLPALARAKGKAQSLSCLNNLKQLQLAWFTYAMDNADQLVPSISDGNRNLPGSWVLGNAQTDAAKSNITSGLLYPYAAALAIYRCPADRSTLLNTEEARLRSYTLNGWLHSAMPVALAGDSGFDFYDFLAQRHKYSEIQRPGPAGVFTFVDEHPDSINDGLWLSVMADPSDSLLSQAVGGGFAMGPGDTDFWVKLPADRHHQGANLSFADGHVDHRRWRAPKLFAEHWQPAIPGGDLQDLRYMESLLPKLPASGGTTPALAGSAEP